MTFRHGRLDVAGLALGRIAPASTHDQLVWRRRPVTDGGATLTALQAMDLAALRREWCRRHGTPPPRLSRDLLLRDLAYTLQADASGGVSKALRRRLRTLAKAVAETGCLASTHGPPVRAGTRLVRAWHGRTYVVTATENGFTYEGETYGSLSAIAQRITGAHWSGPRFFGLRPAGTRAAAGAPSEAGDG